MPAITIIRDATMITVQGKTYNIKEQLKQLGARWNNETKSWQLKNTDDTARKISALIKKNKTKRNCGFCGEHGHFTPKCAKYLEYRKQEYCRRAADMVLNPDYKFKMLEWSGNCSCDIRDESYGIKAFSVKIPSTCYNCLTWCCRLAKPSVDYKPNYPFNFTCPHHGSSNEQFLNDTTGT